MAITTIDEALAGMQQPSYYVKPVSGTLVAGRPFTPFYLGGMPAGAPAPSSGVAGAALTSPVAGQIPFPSGAGNTHLAKFSGLSSAQGGMLLLCDRLWNNSGLSVTTTTAQTVNSVAWPARDRIGSTDGTDVFIGLEIVTATGAGVATPSIGYTSSAGTPGHTASLIDTYVATSASGTFYRFGLQVGSGDLGVRSIQTITLNTSMTSGSISLVAYRVLAALELSAGGIPNAVDALTGCLPRCWAGTVPFLLYVPQTTTTTAMSGQVVFTQG